MKATAASGPLEFLEILRSQPGEWSGAKADAFERLILAFPDPEGPPEWGLRQILRGQFDRRIPPPWRPAFIEVYHQWLGFRAEARAAHEAWPGAMSWWTRSLLPSMRGHGWAGIPATPLAFLVGCILLAWSCLWAASQERGSARRQADAALMALDAVVSRRLVAGESRLAHRMDAGTDEALLDVLSMSADQRALLTLALEERRRAREAIARAKERAGTWWSSPTAIFSAR